MKIINFIRKKKLQKKQREILKSKMAFAIKQQPQKTYIIDIVQKIEIMSINDGLLLKCLD